MFATNVPTRYTPFESDDFDAENGHDGSVFGNLSDGGNAFNNGRGMPSAYGPITFEFQPRALINSGAKEVHIRRTGVYTSDRDGARPLTTSAEIHQLYVDSKGFGRGEFEIPGGTLHLQDAVRVTVAPITVGGRHLIDEVRRVLQGVVNCEITERSGPSYHTTQYQDLVLWAADAPQHGGKSESLPTEIKEWYSALPGVPKTKDNNLRRFADYLEHGTLSRLRGENGHLGPEYVDAEDFDASSAYDISQYAELSPDEIETRDGLVERIRSARRLAISSAGRYNRGLSEAEAEETLEDKRDQARFDYEELASVITEANDWLQSIRDGIQWSIDEVSHLTPDAHDSYAVEEMQAWMDSLEDLEEVPEVDFDTEVEVPEVDLSPLVDMQESIESRLLPDGPYD